MTTHRIYSPAEVCGMFNVSKSTLFRWERDGLLPPVGRDLSGQRRYTDEHLRVLAERQVEKLSRQFKWAAERDADLSVHLNVLESHSLTKFVYKGDLTGLYELAEYPRLSPHAIRELLQVALDQYGPEDPVFAEIVRVAADQTGKLHSGTERSAGV